jgi:hypothetical protein
MQILLIYEQKWQRHSKSNEISFRVSGRIFYFFISRQRLIQEYINSFKSFDDILSKANEGIEFYKKVIHVHFISIIFLGLFSAKCQIKFIK